MNKGTTYLLTYLRTYLLTYLLTYLPSTRSITVRTERVISVKFEAERAFLDRIQTVNVDEEVSVGEQADVSSRIVDRPESEVARVE